MTRGGLHGQRGRERTLPAEEAPPFCAGRRCPAGGQRADSPPPRAGSCLLGCRAPPRCAGPAPARTPQHGGRPLGGPSGLGHYFPRLSVQRACTRRGALGSLRIPTAARGQPASRRSLAAARHPGPPGHTSRWVRGPEGWPGPGDRHAGFGQDAAHGEWVSGFRWGWPGASFRPPWTSAGSPTICRSTAGLLARHGEIPREPVAPRSSGRSAGPRGSFCPPPCGGLGSRRRPAS